MPRSPRAPAATLRSTRPQARGIATRRKLLQAAEALLARRGYEATGMADVAERAGVGVGTLYHHFPDKRALLLALIDDWGDRQLAQNRSELDFARYLGEDPRRAIADDLAERYRELRRDGGLYLVLLELGERDGDVRSRLARIQQVSIERFRDLIAYGQRRGLMRRDVDPLAASFLIRHAIRSAATEVLVHRIPDPAPEQVLEGLTDMICRYILEDPS
jgi:AcrR family transcriptional regulator